MKPMKYNTPKQRLKIYERALKMYANNSTISVPNSHVNSTDGICIALSTLAYGKLTYDSSLCNNSFVEFAKYHNGRGFLLGVLLYKNIYLKSESKWRIKVLTEIIENLKSK